MMINECLLDRKRVQLFKKAINSVVKAGDVVLDAGSGSGIMAFLAKGAGASKVYAVEIDPGISEIIKENVSYLKLENCIEVVNSDIKEIKLPKVDVVIMEMLDTWLAAEQQVPAINALIKNGTIASTTKVIPSGADNYLKFVNYDFDFYGYKLIQPIQARNYGTMSRIKEGFSSRIPVSKVDLTKPNKLECEYTGSFIAKTDGEINAIVLETHLTLADGITSWGTTDMNMPVILPVEMRRVVMLHEYKFSMGYKISCGFDNMKFYWL